MFTLQTRIADALRERPELREMLPAFHPAFEKLKHPLLGRVLPRLVNVEDAARVAGVDPAALLAVMNLPGAPDVGHLPPPPAGAAHEPGPAPAWLDGARVTELDARPLLARGEEPFAAVMTAARALGPGEVLALLTPFEPAPLRRLLGDRGWAHHAAWEGDTCRTSFFFPPEARAPSAARALDLDAHLTIGPDGGRLDARGLEPPQPLHAALAALERPGALPLTMQHRRAPALLYPKLEARGLAWTTTEADGEFTIRIHAPDPV